MIQPRNRKKEVAATNTKKQHDWNQLRLSVSGIDSYLLRTAIIYTLDTEDDDVKLLVTSPARMRLAKMAFDKTQPSSTFVRKFACFIALSVQ